MSDGKKESMRKYKENHKVKHWGADFKEAGWNYIEAIYKMSGMKSRREFILEAGELLLKHKKINAVEAVQSSISELKDE